MWAHVMLLGFRFWGWVCFMMGSPAFNRRGRCNSRALYPVMMNDICLPLVGPCGTTQGRLCLVKGFPPHSVCEGEGLETGNSIPYFSKYDF